METKSGRLELPDVWNNAAKQVAIGSSFTSDPIRRSINQPLDAMKGSPAKPNCIPFSFEIGLMYLGSMQSSANTYLHYFRKNCFIKMILQRGFSKVARVHTIFFVLRNKEHHELAQCTCSMVRVP